MKNKIVDPLGTRIKENYENRTRYYVPRRTYTLIRLDGSHWHTYTRGLNKPFDDGLSQDIDNAIISMLPQIQGVVFAFAQSDEISILLSDFALPTTSAWFDGNIQKMASVSASIITAEFNKLRICRYIDESGLDLRDWHFDDKYIKTAYFDSRIFTIPDRIEVMNYFLWRNQDCARNSVSMVAQSLFSHAQLQGKSTPQMQEMMFKEHNINWSTYDQAKKNGRLIVKEEYFIDMKYPDTNDNKIHINGYITNEGLKSKRSRWVSTSAWKFTEDKERLLSMIPKYV